MRYLFACMIFLQLVMAPPVAAGNVAYLAERNEFGCDIELDGQIEAGDAEKLAAIQDIVWPGESGSMEGPGDGGVLCLSGPGGNLAEAIRMARIRNGPTLVPPNEACESACAILFMAGNVDGIPSREIYASSRLGFHAPALEVEEAQFSASAVSQAYDVAIRTIAEVSALNILPQSAFSVFASTPSSEMHIVTTFRELIENGIGLVQQGKSEFTPRTQWKELPDVGLEQMFLNICTYFYREWQYGRDPLFASSDPVELHSVEFQQGSGYSNSFDVDGTVFIYWVDGMFQPCRVRATIWDTGEGLSLDGTAEYFGQTLFLENIHAWPETDSFAAPASGSVSFDDFHRYVD